MSLKKVRAQIDRLDDQILALLNRRAARALEVRKWKNSQASPGDRSSFTPHREKQVYERLLSKNRGPFPSEALVAVYREIMSASLALEGKPRIAFMGPAMTFSHLAAMSKFGSQCDYVPVAGVPGTFAEVEQSRADFGVVPVENSTEGVIRHTLDLFIDSELKICGEIKKAIHLNLMALRPGMAGLKTVVSHPQPLAQAREWMDKNIPGLRRQEVSSTAVAAQMAARDRALAVIGDLLLAEAYGLKVIARNIQDKNDNMTRFLVIGRTLSRPSGKDKTSIMLSIRDHVGALAAMLKPFEKNKVNLTSIESRPSRRRAWEYFFFIDFLGHQEEPKVKRALDELRKQVQEVKVLGSYPLA